MKRNNHITQKAEEVLATLLLVVSSLIPLTSSADSFMDAYTRALDRTQSIEALDDKLFGDSVSTMDGATEFKIVDVSAPTNGTIPVSFGRVMRISAITQDAGGIRRFGDSMMGSYWDPDLPMMSATVSTMIGWSGYSIYGMPNQSNPNRCSQAGIGPADAQGFGNFRQVQYPVGSYFTGVHISIPGVGTEQLLKFPDSKDREHGGVTYVATTRSNWLIGCLPSLKQGAGEGFFVLLPDGTRYYFDWPSGTGANSLYDKSCGSSGFFPSQFVMQAPAATSCSTAIVIPRSTSRLMASRAVDRFGNSVTWTYDTQTAGHLKEIASSDGTKITFTYGSTGRLDTVTSNSRSWKYQFDQNGQGLLAVTQPDGSRWTIDYGSNIYGINEYESWRVWSGCKLRIDTKTSTATPWAGETNIVTMTHPSGANGRFHFRKILHGTKMAEAGCNYAGDARYGHGTVIVDPSDYQVASLYLKEITGAGLSQSRWTYTYTPSWDPPYTTKVDIVDPEGIKTSYIHGLNREWSYGKLLEKTVSSNGKVFRTEKYEYLLSAAGQTFPDMFGRPMAGGAGSWGDFNIFRNRPLIRRTVEQDGLTFIYEVDKGCDGPEAYCFDQYVRPTRETHRGP